MFADAHVEAFGGVTTGSYRRLVLLTSLRHQMPALRGILRKA